MAIISVQNLTKSFKVNQKEKGFIGSVNAIFNPKYKEIQAVKNISFEVDEGEIIAFIGPNGAGKSTTIKMLTGILYPDSGNIEILGINPTKSRKKLTYEIGTVFGQKEQLWMHLTAYDNFKFFGAIYDISEKETEKRIDELSKLFNLEKFINMPVRSLSLGQRIICEIVASLIHKPKILFLDEPTIGLDPVVKESIRKLIKKMNLEYHTTVFLTSHDISDIEKLCKRVVIINKGQIVIDDSMNNLKYHYMDKKLIEVKLKNNFDFSNIKGIKVLEQNANSFSLEINTKQINWVTILKLIKPENIIDINISNTPFEEIISEIYRKE